MDDKQKIGNLMTTIIPKGDNVVGDEVDLEFRGKKVGVGRIMVILSMGGTLMKVIVEIIRWINPTP